MKGLINKSRALWLRQRTELLASQDALQIAYQQDTQQHRDSLVFTWTGSEVLVIRLFVYYTDVVILGGIILNAPLLITDNRYLSESTDKILK